MSMAQSSELMDQWVKDDPTDGWSVAKNSGQTNLIQVQILSSEFIVRTHKSLNTSESRCMRLVWCRVVFTYLEMPEGSAPVITSVWEGPESPEEQQKVPVLLHPEMIEPNVKTFK